MKMTKKKWLLLAVCAAVAVGVGVTYAKKGSVKPMLMVQPLGRGELVSHLSVSGNVSNNQVDEFILSGDSEVATVNVKAGDTVKAGDVLVTFDHADAMNAYKKAAIAYETKRLQLDETQRKYFKLQEDIKEQKDDIAWLKLKKDEYEDSIDPEEIQKYEDYYNKWRNAKDELESMEDSVMSDEAIKIEQLAFEQAKMDMDEAELAVSRLPQNIVATHDGVVDSVGVTPYTTATRGTKAVTVRTTSATTVDFEVSRFDVAKLALGQRAVVTIAGKEYTGTVTTIDPIATSDSNLKAKVTIDDPQGLIPGMDADLEITTYEAKDVLVLPIEAVKTDRVGDYCFIVTPIEGGEEGQQLYAPTKTYITTGNSSDMELEVLDGLEEGALVVSNPTVEVEMMTAVTIPDGIAAGVPADGASPDGTGGPDEASAPAASAPVDDSSSDASGSGEDAAPDAEADGGDTAQ